MFRYLNELWWRLKLGRACGQPWWSLKVSDGAYLLRSIWCDITGHDCVIGNDRVSGGDWRMISFKCRKCTGFLGMLDAYVDLDGNESGWRWTHRTCEECGHLFPNVDCGDDECVAE